MGLRRPGRGSAIHRVQLPARREQVTARLTVRRVRDAPNQVENEQGELFRAWRHHAVFTDSPNPMIQAEADHRRHEPQRDLDQACLPGGIRFHQHVRVLRYQSQAGTGLSSRPRGSA